MLPQPDNFLTPARFLLAAVPLLAIALALLHLRRPLFQAALLTCALTVFLSLSFFGMGGEQFLSVLGKGVAFTLFIAIVIVSAILFYTIVKDFGIMEAMGERLLFLGDRPLLQVLVLAWCFAGFMEGFIGFGIPVILVAPFLITGGLTPFLAVSLTLVGHAWAVTYGTLGVALFTLALSSRIPVGELAYALAAQFTLAFTLTGLAVAHLYQGLTAVRTALLHILTAGAAGGLAFFACAAAGAPQLSALLGGLAAMAALVAADRVCPVPKIKRDNVQDNCRDSTLPLFDAFAPYGFLCVVALLFQANPLRLILGRIGFSFTFREHITALGYVVPAEPDFVRLSLRHPGSAILLACLFSLLLFWRRGYHGPAPAIVMVKALRQSVPTVATLLILVTTAMLMNDAGMTTVLALGLSRLTGFFYPLLAPFIGLLGTFLTGSNTNSNLLFGLFQHQAALSLGITPAILVAAHTAAASVASSIAPAKILIATSAIGNRGEERALLARTLPYCLLLTVAAGLLVYFF